MKQLAPGIEFDRYVIESLLGVGGMGRVYRAFDTRLRRSVALKALDPALDTEDLGLVDAMLHEARAAAAILHPNVTAIFDADRIGETSFIVMELVSGTPLRSRIGDASVPLATRLRWLVDIAAGLDAAHRAGVVHRDIKPENVILRDDGVVKVLDFGIARVVANTPAFELVAASGAAPAGQSGMAGTPAYMAPEQTRGGPVDGRADQFAWGVVAYELLAGQLPWRRGPLFRMLFAVLNEEAAPFADEACVPLPVAAAVHRALAKKAEDRFPSMADAAAALAPFTEGLTPPSTSPPDSAPVSAPPSAPPSFERGAPVASTREPPPLPIPTPPFREPEFGGAVDLEAHLALLPLDATCKGMFFNDLLRLGAAARPAHEILTLAHVRGRRFIAFRDYSMHEMLRLMVAVGRVTYPHLPLGQALRRIGWTVFATVLGSHVGRTVLGVFGRDLPRMLELEPTVHKLLTSFGSINAEALGNGAYHIRVRDLPTFLETYQVGVFEGLLRHCGARGHLRIALEGLAQATYELTVL